MTIRDRIRTLRNVLDPRGWLLLALLVLVAGVSLWWVLTEPGRQARKAAEAKAGQVIAEGQAKAGREAVAIQDKALGGAKSDEDLSRETADAIRNAPGADQPLNPGLNDTGRRRMCQREAYRDRPECVRLLGGADDQGEG